jgi:hypothetical protein
MDMEIVAASQSIAELERRQQELTHRSTAATLDLGGLAYEMANREDYRVDTLARRAAEVHAIDDELAEVEGQLAAARDGVAGQCPTCAAPHSRGAVYCWRCGGRVDVIAASPTSPH